MPPGPPALAEIVTPLAFRKSRILNSSTRWRLQRHMIEADFTAFGQLVLSVCCTKAMV
jgi:hypothetical protein